ncbi:MAG: DinB family protein [Treponema sp.]|jgi:uncharacterized damage-inducible protein DinB|nr:DinB family protein [Treponema sp.]
MASYHLGLLADYNKEANRKMDAVIKTLSGAEWDKTFPGYFKSIHELCSHIYVCDYAWLVRYKGLRDFACLDQQFLSKNYRFDETIFSGRDEYLAMRPELDDKIIAFVNELGPEDPGKQLTYTDSGGVTRTRKMEGLVLHLLNHETHHRAMISLYLEMMGKENDFNSVSSIL